MKHVFIIGLCSAAVAAMSLSGCASPGEERTERVSTDCFNTRQARDFRVLDDHNLIVYAPGRSRPYLVELSRSCQSLRFEHSIGLSSRGDRFCGFAGDAVLVRGGIPDRCPVMSVRRLDEVAHEEMLRRFDGEVPDDLGDDAAGEIVIEIPRAEDEDEDEDSSSN